MGLHRWYCEYVYVCANGIVLPEVEYVTLYILRGYAVLVDDVLDKSEVDCETLGTYVAPVDSHYRVVVLAEGLLRGLRRSVQLRLTHAVVDALSLARGGVLVNTD